MGGLFSHDLTYGCSFALNLFSFLELSNAKRLEKSQIGKKSWKKRNLFSRKPRIVFASSVSWKLSFKNQHVQPFYDHLKCFLGDVMAQCKVIERSKRFRKIAQAFFVCCKGELEVMSNHLEETPTEMKKRVTVLEHSGKERWDVFQKKERSVWNVRNSNWAFNGPSTGIQRCVKQPAEKPKYVL